ncbi:hypothetical protein PYCCODRAFT_1453309 [Trametes coccinea BRFM310]|uniref:CFEM domain-containing protein n=1 Tax=Trametes coccinea (strain BRFM310) TaxID=1353009 RepID=A0A1Y2IHH1_TRAC3|nr:hypothetical protein PYCCODRAFT_1453309 [Trametes coccinea BRFM310]
MRFFAVLALAAALSTASAAQIDRRQAGYPSCALPCLASADFGSCDPTDDNCLCHSSGFINSVTSCVVSACSGSDLQQAESAAQQACASVGVTLTATPSGSQTSSAAPSGTSPASSGSASSSTSAAPAATSSTNAASSRSANALAALAVVGAAALVL